LIIFAPIGYLESVQAKLVSQTMERKSIVLPLRIDPNREDSVVIARRREATTKQSPDARGDCFARKRLARNDGQVWLRLEAALMTYIPDIVCAHTPENTYEVCIS
jgi:hypothetical protein